MFFYYYFIFKEGEHGEPIERLPIFLGALIHSIKQNTSYIRKLNKIIKSMQYFQKKEYLQHGYVGYVQTIMTIKKIE